ncbi:MAG TPA: ATP-binding protein [Thermodesulfobacteriota bacterium]|nr:ATP-binding protein [Thermodesulfobacteriota bacterium]
MLTAWGIAAVALLYVLGLFAIAYYVDRQARAGRNLIDSPLIYSLSLAVYCTSWTFYGSVGRAVASGVGFLPIYLGPTLMALLWWFVLRKTVRIAKANNITSIADFLGSRYGQSALLGGVVAVVTVVGITPYIALQLKAISQTFEVLVRYPEVVTDLVPSGSRPFYTDTAFGTAIILTLFGIMFGARDLDSSRRHEGLVATIAFESLVKLLAFLAVGLFVTYGAFDGFVDIVERVAGRPEYARFLGGDPAFSYGDWAALTWLSMMAILFLPRQFHMAVVGNTREGHIRTAMWMFPAYLLLINLFVLPIAFGGLLTFPTAPATAADYFVLTLPMAHHQQWLALFAFIGGISAATGMVIVESIALSTMILNNLVVPWLVRLGVRRDISGLLINLKRLAIGVTICLGYVYYHLIGESYTLVNIGLISFAAVAQFAPAFFGGLYWRGATRQGALAGLSTGFLVWGYTLLVPAFVRSGWLADSLVTAGPFGIGWLRPEQLFGLTALGFWSNTVFWSLAFNLAAFAVVSLLTRPTPLELAQAERFVGASGRLPAPPTGAASRQGLTLVQLEELVAKFLGPEKAQAAFADFVAARGIRDPQALTEADRLELTRFAERTLSGAVGAASAQAILEGLGQVATGRFEAIFDVFGKVSRSLEQSREDLQRRVRELSLLYEATRRIAATLDPQRMMDDVVELLAREFEFDLLTVRLCDPDGRLRIKSQAGLPPGTDLSHGDPVSRETYFGDCFLDNRVVVVEDAAAIRKPVVLPAAGMRLPRSFVHVPIVVEERPIGVLSAYSSTGRVYFSPEFLQFFRTLGVQLGLGIKNAQLYRELGDLSRELEAKVRQRTAELEEANRRLTELDRLKSDFVSTVSHELRTPLTSIRSLSESLLAGGDIPRETQEQFLAIIVQESQRLSRLIAQLLDLARIEAGRIEWRMEPLDLGEVAAHAVRTHRALFDGKGIAVTLEPPAAPLPVVADRDRLLQVLTNLLSNAAKFTPAGGRVTVRAFADAASAVVEVEDTGVGIPADQLETIFERFRQVGDTLTAKPEGAGLGLPISRDIVRHHGGTLTVRSQPGRGSCFRVALPLAAAARPR